MGTFWKEELLAMVVVWWSHNSVAKHKRWKEWIQGKTYKEYLEAKKKVKKVRLTVYQIKCKSERKRFGKVNVFKIAKGIFKTNEDISG